MKAVAAATLLAATVSAAPGVNGAYGGWASCALTQSECSSLFSSAVQTGFQAFCTDAAALSSANSCIGNSQCTDKDSITSSINSWCSGASTWTAGPWPTGTAGAAWSSWASNNGLPVTKIGGGPGGPGPFGANWGASLSDWPAGGPWTAGGPFGGAWGPFGTNGPWTNGGPWTSWWGNGVCPGSSWTGWTSGTWSTSCDWTSWTACTATTVPTVITAVPTGTGALATGVSLSSTYSIKVAQATSTGKSQTGAAGPAVAGGVPMAVGVVGAVFAGFIGVIGML